MAPVASYLHPCRCFRSGNLGDSVVPRSQPQEDGSHWRAVSVPWTVSTSPMTPDPDALKKINSLAVRSQTHEPGDPRL